MRRPAVSEQKILLRDCLNETSTFKNLIIWLDQLIYQ